MFLGHQISILEHSDSEDWRNDAELEMKKWCWIRKIYICQSYNGGIWGPPQRACTEKSKSNMIYWLVNVVKGKNDINTVHFLTKNSLICVLGHQCVLASH